MNSFIDVDPKIAIDVLSEEVRKVSDYNLYLLAVIRQLQQNAEQEREAWELKFASLKTENIE